VYSDGTSILPLHIGDQRRDNWLPRTYCGKGEAIAQGRRFTQNRVAGNYSHDDFWSRESILEVGGAYLPEALQGRRLPRIPDTLDVTGAVDADIQCGNHTRCNHSTHFTDDALTNRIRPTIVVIMTSAILAIPMEPATSRIHLGEDSYILGKDSHVLAVRGRQRIVQKALGQLETGNDRKELWGLSCALLFETLKVMLLISITIV
jgi:hypothetical protein